MLQLEILGKQDLFRNIFDYGKWSEEKARYIANVVAGKDNDLMNRDLYESMLEHNYPIPRIKPKPFYKRVYSKLRSILKRLIK
jgi:hypothetical protein